MARSKSPIPPLDLSRYSNEERLPPNIISIIKNALIVFECNTAKIAKHYKLPKEKIDLIYEENYLQISQIMSAKTKSKELDTGIDNSIKLITGHINSLENQKSADIMTNSTVNNVIKLTDRMVALKQQYNNTYDIIVNKMIEQSLKERAVTVQESGKLEDVSDYNENVETVFTKLKASAIKVKASNIKTKEVLHFGTLREAGNYFSMNPDYIRTKIQMKTLYKDEWCFEKEE